MQKQKKPSLSSPSSALVRFSAGRCDSQSWLKRTRQLRNNPAQDRSCSYLMARMTIALEKPGTKRHCQLLEFMWKAQTVHHVRSGQPVRRPSRTPKEEEQQWKSQFLKHNPPSATDPRYPFTISYLYRQTSPEIVFLHPTILKTSIQFTLLILRPGANHGSLTIDRRRRLPLPLPPRHQPRLILRPREMAHWEHVSPKCRRRERARCRKRVRLFRTTIPNFHPQPIPMLSLSIG